ncbi:ATP-binding protein [Polaribacter sp. Hel_I_88]|uniref:tetratricopeptide repeat-containing sensor histidine kinase n=1 Tax=Polaribacter sp. Hel_I_88 TaxID=1250006 RepID=UPI00047AF90E|nr:ATP-binding protein [Polaribacter sp. Hel_I_88]
MKKIVIVIVFLFSFTPFVFSQSLQNEIDSLKIELKNTKDENVKIEILFTLTKNYSRISIDSALKYSDLGLNLAKKINDFENLAEMYVSSGGAYFRKGDAIKSKDYFFKALKIRQNLNDTLGIALTKANLVSYYGKYKKLDSAMIYAIEAVDVIDKKGNKRQANMLKANIGALYQLKYNYDKALEYYLEALEYSKSVNFDNFTTTLYSNLAIIYNYKNDIQKCIESNLKSVEYAKKTNNNEIISNSLTNLGSVYLNNGKTNKGIETLEEALIYSKKYNSETQSANLKYNLAKNYFKQLSFTKAEKLFYDAKAHFEKVNDNRKLFIANNYLGYISASKKDFEKMFFFKSQSDSINDKYMEDTNQKKMEELETKYQTEKKEKELLQTRTEKAETELQLSKTRTWTFVLIGSLAILIFLSLAIFQRNKRKHQLAIANQKEKNLQSILFAEEKERTRIARELHDGVVQQIGSAILKSRDLFSKLKISDNESSKAVLSTLEESSEDLRNISHQMMPRALSELGLVSAIDDLLKGSLAHVNIEYTFEHFNVKERLPEKIEITLYRITQELVNNIIKHSKATSVSVQLINSADHIIFIVEDDGIGINLQKSKKGIGFDNIKSRLEMINGEASFDKSPEKGTLITVKIKK